MILENGKPLEGRSAVITGGANGLGLCIAKRLADAGAAITIVDLPANGGAIADNCRMCEINLAEDDAATKLASLAASLGTLDVLVANAGVVPPWRGIAELDLGSRGIRVNALAPGPIATDALLARVATRHMAGGSSPDDALAALAGETALGHIATQEDVANAALFLASDASAGMTGAVLPVDGRGFTCDDHGCGTIVDTRCIGCCGGQVHSRL